MSNEKRFHQVTREKREKRRMGKNEIGEKRPKKNLKESRELKPVQLRGLFLTGKRPMLEVSQGKELQKARILPILGGGDNLSDLQRGNNKQSAKGGKEAVSDGRRKETQ